MSDGWKIDHNDQGDLEATHQHDRGGQGACEQKRGEDGLAYFVCPQCGDRQDIGDRSSGPFVVR